MVNIMFICVGAKQICRHLLKNKDIDVDMETKGNKQTPLIVACMRGNYQVMRMLLLAGAQVNKPNVFNYTPFVVTVFRLVEQPHIFENKRLCFRILAYLIKYGADINWIINKQNGYTILHYLCASTLKLSKPLKQLNYQLIKYLIIKGANVGQKTLLGQKIRVLLENHCNKQRIANLIVNYKYYVEESVKIRRYDVQKLGDDYFRMKTSHQ